ncbi:MAG: sulfite:cytochrome C oxidoreductase subunit A [Aquificota bacterium]|nr:MAG: sulfite:cytochrome C oxidoreductase subunit A [Aquificota bacterium]
MGSRRDFLKKSFLLAGATALGNSALGKALASTLEISIDNYPPLVDNYPGKKPLILHVDRPPVLETPKKYFDRAITPNDAFFLRWHLANIPTEIDTNKWRLKIQGNVEKPVELSLDDLKTKFEPVSYYAVLQCSGNGRAFYQKTKTATGTQWTYGGMGNALWTGVRLSDVLRYAGVKIDSIEVVFDGLDSAPYPKTPDVIRSLHIDKCLYEDLILAYEMNGEPLSLLNGFPLRLVVPGWYATHWIKSLSTITVLNKHFRNFWMDKAYHIPANAYHCMVPKEKNIEKRIVTFMNVKSVIAKPEDGAVFKKDEIIKLAGVAFDKGYGIKAVLLSFDNGKTWKPAYLGPELGKYSFREWFYYYKPERKGNIKILVKAINKIDEEQPYESGWNPGGYMWNGLDSITIKIV